MTCWCRIGKSARVAPSSTRGFGWVVSGIEFTRARWEGGSVFVGLGGGGDRVAFEGVEGGVPAEGGALDSGRKRVDAGESGEVADVFGGLAGGDDVVELVVEFLDFGGGLAFDLRGHERSAGLGDGAAGAVEGDFRDPVVGGGQAGDEAEVDAAFVAAGRVVAMGDTVGGGQLTAIPGAAVVVEDNLLVEFGEIGGHAGRRGNR